MTQNFSNVSLFDATDVLVKIQAAGFDAIRCNLTGRKIAEIGDDVLMDAVRYIRFEQPLLDDSQIVDLMQMRWIVQCSRPAPHLVSFQSHDAHTYLANHHPRDLFAILIGRMLFDHDKIDREMSLVEAQKAKLFWLVQLQDSEEFQAFDSNMRKALDALVRIDSIHSIRKCLYTDKIRQLTAGVRNEPVTAKMLIAFIEEVESHGLNSLTKRTVPPEGNRQSLNAALAQAGLLPWQVRLKQNEANQKTQALAFAEKVIAQKKLSDLERIKAGYAEKHTVVLEDLSGQIPAILQQKYEDAIQREQTKKSPNKTNRKGKTSASVMRAAARFGDLDFSL